MADFYSSFSVLQQKESPKNYNATYGNLQQKNCSFLALHGGKIEPGTEEIVRELAGEDFAYYIFSGKKLFNNKKLHVTSAHFDDPIAQDIVKSSSLSFSLHGCKEKKSILFIGGGNNLLKTQLFDHLLPYAKDLGCELKLCEGEDEFSGENQNIVNLNGNGILLELSKGLRKKLFKNYLTQKGRHGRKEAFIVFCSSIKTFIQEQNLKA